jgi:hypothetical protein
VIDPILAILAWPIGVFAWVLFDLRRRESKAAAAAEAAAPAPAAVPAEQAASAWRPSVGAAA